MNNTTINIHYISKKIMRQKDYNSLKKKHASYKMFRKGHEILYRTPRGWFFTHLTEDKQSVTGEISVTTAQNWLLLNGFTYTTGW